MTKRIAVTPPDFSRDINFWTATLEPGWTQFGDTKEQAVGRLVMHHRKECGLEFIDHLHGDAPIPAKVTPTPAASSVSCPLCAGTGLIPAAAVGTIGGAYDQTEKIGQSGFEKLNDDLARLKSSPSS